MGRRGPMAKSVPRKVAAEGGAACCVAGLGGAPVVRLMLPRPTEGEGPELLPPTPAPPIAAVPMPPAAPLVMPMAIPGLPRMPLMLLPTLALLPVAPKIGMPLAEMGGCGGCGCCCCCCCSGGCCAMLFIGLLRSGLLEAKKPAKGSLLWGTEGQSR